MVEVQFKTEADKLEFLDRLHGGDPVIWGRLVIEERKQQLEAEREEEEEGIKYEGQ